VPARLAAFGSLGRRRAPAHRPNGTSSVPLADYIGRYHFPASRRRGLKGDAVCAGTALAHILSVEAGEVVVVVLVELD
jgi:hypothetical protein